MEIYEMNTLMDILDLKILVIKLQRVELSFLLQEKGIVILPVTGIKSLSEIVYNSSFELIDFLIQEQIN